MASAIVFHDLTASVRLGWTPVERTTLQPITIDLRLEFDQTPRACETDRLNDTVCYGELAELILTVCGRKEYRLLEHLGAQVLKALRRRVGTANQLTIRITKPHPPIAALRGGVSFIFGDSVENAW